MDGEYINTRSGRARETEQALVIGHKDDATCMMLSVIIFTQGPGVGKDFLYREESIHQAIFIIINVPLSKHFWRRVEGALM